MMDRLRASVAAAFPIMSTTRILRSLPPDSTSLPAVMICYYTWSLRKLMQLKFGFCFHPFTFNDLKVCECGFKENPQFLTMQVLISMNLA
ncbi:hypothetical protein NPIL_69881 [Nephila pilipes]|uniref:Uncharacterized protein n=1 Tax=Nephila pilipes TaxID=299642 RepID=A0A8X6U578_NEPPI|nr:hypothetical protein NPIL_69881 [Nephila pilipes]